MNAARYWTLCQTSGLKVVHRHLIHISVRNGKSNSGSKKDSRLLPGAGTPIIIEGSSASASSDHVFHGDRVSALAHENFDNSKAIQGNSRAVKERECYEPRSNVSLSCVMQSNVPEPYTKRPAHYNMPGNNRKVDQKYVFNALNATHQSRNFHSKAVVAENAGKYNILS